MISNQHLPYDFIFRHFGVVEILYPCRTGRDLLLEFSCSTWNRRWYNQKWRENFYL